MRYRNRIKAILGWEIKTYAGLFLLVHNIWYCGSESSQMLWQYCGLGVHVGKEPGYTYMGVGEEVEAG